MKLLIALLAALLLIPCGLARAEDEAVLIAMLAPDKTPAQKDAACQQLRGIATAKAVPALAALLPDENLSQSARMVLQNMPDPAAGEALRQALDKATEKTLAGIIDSIGERHDAQAITQLAQLLKSDDRIVARAAASALGKTGGEEALSVLELAGNSPYVTEALLACAATLHDRSPISDTAMTVYTVGDRHPEQLQTATYRLMIISAGTDSAKLVGEGLLDPQRLLCSHRAAQLACLEQIRQPSKSIDTQICVRLLAKADATILPALIEVLGQRGDPNACEAVVNYLVAEDPNTRIAACHALASIGTSAAIEPLARFITQHNGAEQEAARFALSRVNGPGARDAIIQGAEKPAGSPRIELIRAIGSRCDTTAIPLLLRLLSEQDATVRLAAAESLAQAGDDTAVGGMAKSIATAKSDADRETLEKSLSTISGRITDKQKIAPDIVSALSSADTPGRCGLLRLCGTLTGPAVLSALRDGLKSPDPAIQDAAIRGLCAIPDINAEPDLEALTQNAPNLTHKVLALRGCVRLIDQLPMEKRILTCQHLMAAAQRPDERKLILGSAAKVASRQSLDFVEPSLQDSQVKPEALLACSQIAAALRQSHPADALIGYRRIVQAGGDEKIVTDAKANIAKLEAGQK